MNTFFLCLACMTLFFILGGPTNTDFMLVELPVLFLTSLMTLTQYVIVPYDTLAYFFLSIAALLIIKTRQTFWNSVALCIVVVLATLTRETATLILAFYFAVHYRTILTKPKNFRINPKQSLFLIIITCFIGAYTALRFAFGFEQAIYQDFSLLRNANPLSLMSSIFLASLVLLVSITKVVKKEIFVFLIGSLPYILPLFLIADLWEIRLWTPIILLLVILKARSSIGKQNFKGQLDLSSDSPSG